MRSFLAIAILLAGCAPPVQYDAVEIEATYATDPVPDDPDDPAIWLHPEDPGKSLILGTNKVAAPNGALHVFGLDGRMRQTIKGIDRPNNVDVEYGFLFNGTPLDIAVVTERYQHRLRIFHIPAEGGDLREIGAVPVFEGQRGEASEPMGIGLYKRPTDSAVFAVVSRKSGPKEDYLWQYLLEDDGSNGIRGTKVREFGTFSGKSEIEAIAVDDELSFVYYADEGRGIRKWAADPDYPAASRELALFGTTGFRGDREGIAIYKEDSGTGYIICTDQRTKNSQYVLFRREGAIGNPHDHSEVVKVVKGPADSTDGIEATSTFLGPELPAGILIAMNEQGKNFLVFDWRVVEGAQSAAVRVPFQ